MNKRYIIAYTAFILFWYIFIQYKLTSTKERFIIESQKQNNETERIVLSWVNESFKQIGALGNFGSKSIGNFINSMGNYVSDNKGVAGMSVLGIIYHLELLNKILNFLLILKTFFLKWTNKLFQNKITYIYKDNTTDEQKLDYFLTKNKIKLGMVEQDNNPKGYYIHLPYIYYAKSKNKIYKTSYTGGTIKEFIDNFYSIDVNFNDNRLNITTKTNSLISLYTINYTYNDNLKKDASLIMTNKLFDYREYLYKKYYILFLKWRPENSELTYYTQKYYDDFNMFLINNHKSEIPDFCSN